MSFRIHLSHEECMKRAHAAATEIRKEFGPNPLVYAIPRGGVVAAYLIQRFHTGIVLVENPDDANVAVDDIFDSGKTARRMSERHGLGTIVLVNKQREMQNEWVVFPWETANEDIGPEENVRRLIQHMGDDPDRPGLLETPTRYLRALTEWGSGYAEQDIGALLKTFEDGAEGSDEMVMVKDIPFHSLCEHHMAPFFGHMKIAYIPNGRIVGLSKFARLVNYYAARLQVQERLTVQIAEAMQKHLKPIGVGVMLEARHMCMEIRGVKAHGATTRTVALPGAFKNDAATRAEFLA